MKIEKPILIKILFVLRNKYPGCLMSYGYETLIEEVGDKQVVDGHLIYLADKGLINIDAVIVGGPNSVPGRPETYSTEWEFNNEKTRINADGLDWLVKQQV